VPTLKDIKSEISIAEDDLNQVREDAAEIAQLAGMPGAKANFQRIKALAENVSANVKDASESLSAASGHCEHCELD